MEGTLGEIRLFAANFAPRNWAYCDGATLPINTNTALFSIIGTKYGGNGTNNFVLPDLSGRTAIGTGYGANIPPYNLGQKKGANTTLLTVGNLPSHTHDISGNILIPAYSEEGNTNSPSNNVLARCEGLYSSSESDSLTQSFPITVQVGAVGSNQPINIMKPSLGMNYIICIRGTYPQRS